LRPSDFGGTRRNTNLEIAGWRPALL